MPLFYADMDTLIERLGELRLLAQAPPPAPPTGISKEGGKEIVTPPPPGGGAQLWNDFDSPNVLSTLGLGPRSATANYSIPTVGASLKIGKRWDFGHFFIEPQGQIAGAWAGGSDYTVSTGLRVSAGSQASLRGRLGVRTGYHFDFGSRAFEPYAKVSVINEFLGGDRISTNQNAFFPTLSGAGIQAAGGVTARLADSIYLYGECDYANSDKIRIPWAVDAGLRWEW
jgi:outer membrane autotransporter protein